MAANGTSVCVLDVCICHMNLFVHTASTPTHPCVVFLLTGGDALERGYHVNTVIFDKTGTLTVGRPQVMEAAVFSRHYTLQQVRVWSGRAIATLNGRTDAGGGRGPACGCVCVVCIHGLSPPLYSNLTCTHTHHTHTHRFVSWRQQRRPPASTLLHEQ